MGLGSTPPVALGFPDNDPDFEQNIRIQHVDCSLRFWKGHVQEGREETAAYVRIQIDPIAPSFERGEDELRSLRDGALSIFSNKNFTTTTTAPIRGSQQQEREDSNTFYVLPSRALPSQNSQELFDSVLRALESGSRSSGPSAVGSSPQSPRKPSAVRDDREPGSPLDQFVESTVARLKQELGGSVPSTVTAALYRLGQAMLPRDELRTSLGADSTDVSQEVERCQALVLESFKGEVVPVGPLAHLTVALEAAIVQRKRAEEGGAKA